MLVLKSIELNVSLVMSYDKISPSGIKLCNLTTYITYKTDV